MPGIERIAQAVAQQIEDQHRQKEAIPGKTVSHQAP
jgi:hypothetical protein